MNFVPCLTWVAKGIAKSRPDRVQLQPEELKALIEETKEEIGQNDIDSNEEDVSEGENKVTEEISDHSGKSDDDFDTKYDLDAYDDEEDDRPLIKMGDIAVHVDNKEDKYITDYDAVQEDEEEEEEDFIIKDNDNLLVVGHVEEESSTLEIYVYNKDEDAFYVHHDIVLPAYPLALEWLNFHPSDEELGNYLAVGDMTPVIKVWDLDVADILEPDYTLGKKRKKKKAEQKSNLKCHSDAVLSLSWNKHVRNILASGSADTTIILWDLQEGRAANRLRFHQSKVQALQWSPLENSYLLSGCTDGLIKLYDVRTDVQCKTWNVNGEVEKVFWHISDSSKFFCSTDQGLVYSFNVKTDKIENNVHAHTQGVTGLDMCSEYPNVLITASMDKTIKLWNIESGFNLLSSQKLKVGSIYTAKCAPDSGLVLAVGGNNASNNLKLVDDLAAKIDGGEKLKECVKSEDSTRDYESNKSIKDISKPKKTFKKFESVKTEQNVNTPPPVKKKFGYFQQSHQNSWKRNFRPGGEKLKECVKSADSTRDYESNKNRKATWIPKETMKKFASVKTEQNDNTPPPKKKKFRHFQQSHQASWNRDSRPSGEKLKERVKSEDSTRDYESNENRKATWIPKEDIIKFTSVKTEQNDNTPPAKKKKKRRFQQSHQASRIRNYRPGGKKFKIFVKGSEDSTRDYDSNENRKDISIPKKTFKKFASVKTEQNDNAQRTKQKKYRYFHPSKQKKLRYLHMSDQASWNRNSGPGGEKCVKSEDSTRNYESNENRKDISIPKKTIIKFASVKTEPNDNEPWASPKKKKFRYFQQSDQVSWNRDSRPSTSYNTQTERPKNNVKKYE